MARDDYDEFDDQADDEEPDELQDDEPELAPIKVRKKPGWETACVGLASVLIVLAGVAVSYHSWQEYDVRGLPLFFMTEVAVWPVKVEPLQVDAGRTARIVALRKVEVPGGSRSSRLAVPGAVLDQGAEHGVEIGQIYQVKDTGQELHQLVVCRVEQHRSEAFFRVQTRTVTVGEGETPVTTVAYPAPNLKDQGVAERLESGQQPIRTYLTGQ